MKFEFDLNANQKIFTNNLNSLAGYVCLRCHLLLKSYMRNMYRIDIFAGDKQTKIKRKKNTQSPEHMNIECA